MKQLWIAAIFCATTCWASAQQQAMPGMIMQSPQTMQMPKDMQTPTPNDPAAGSESQSMQGSEHQQRIQHDMKPGPESDRQSISHNTMTLQEPENESYKTGHDLPAPELLNDVANRAPMGVDDFISMAEKSNPTLDQVRSFVRRSDQQGRQAGMWPNPSIGYSGDHIRGGVYGGGEQGAYLQQEIVLGGKLGLRRNIYKQEAQVNQIGVDEQTYRVRDSVQQAFYRALTSQALVVVRQRLLKVAADAVETAHQLANVGQADAPDVLQAEVESEQAKVDYVHAQREYLQDFHMLAAVAGAQNLAVNPLKGDLEHPPAIDTDAQITNIMAHSPAMKRAEQQVAVAEARIKEAKREPIPNLTVRAGEWYSGEVIESAHKPAGPESFVDASVNIPLWNRNQGNIEAAKVELERARQDIKRTQLYLKQQSEPLAQQYLSSRFEAERYGSELLPRARRAYQLYLMKYQQMAGAYPQVLVSQRTLFQLQVDYLQALGMEWSNALALQNYTLTNGLEQPMAAGTDTTTLNLPTAGGNQ
jgi:cobalt-zinc-cadmium efflux system outer membrane protein